MSVPALTRRRPPCPALALARDNALLLSTEPSHHTLTEADAEAYLIVCKHFSGVVRRQRFVAR